MLRFMMSMQGPSSRSNASTSKTVVESGKTEKRCTISKGRNVRNVGCFGCWNFDVQNSESRLVIVRNKDL